ncbi:hypothetical protein [Chitinibacter tainanensis]|uniref:hypothetical protein n=1 Tax=Chitinibacter tainanensis TaxID=230667 RepID=UPI00048FDA59|nr:hypothetical protein [Chitinibacter tainanensis]
MTKAKSQDTKLSRSRSENPFREHQEKVVAEREEIIASYLASLRKTRAEFKFITDLAKAVARQIEMTEGAPCSFTTLLRNERYKIFLLNFMTMRSGTETIKASEPKAQALIYRIELELGNTKRDNERLRNYIKAIELQLLDKQAGTTLSPVQNSDSTERLIKLSNDKALVCKALWLVLEHFRDLMSIDVDRGCIIDRSASLRKNVIVEPGTSEPFLEWVNSNQSIGKNPY